ncbi:tyrosine-type recombinase/integrase [Paraburkholderia sp. CNPSo 3281]|uniref:tyrosine-type recombinase/integrase n=1 Tax=Paraburkholderia sp. CNPSo 3281 TaxID=2940933 RepID=UPI0020B7515C|nr:tyrosine-type recombinase/integrase [Paraburkholderia sp. CNPSo 3281]MCP3720813.1 tyrosine-type recombinase/integrase [Paraburkholderia sp. CNPSo 3281]
MASDSAVVELVWERYPLIASNSCARRWIESCVMLGLARNTIKAYMYAIEGFLRFAVSRSVDLRSVSRETIAQYVGELRTQPRRVNANVVRIDSGGFLSNATLQQRLTAVRLLFEFLVDEGLVRTNPVSRGRYTASSRFGARRERGLIQKFHKLPWIPTEAQWVALLAVVRNEPKRNRCMLALAYDAALRREELCQLRSSDIDPAYRLLRIRAETTKGHRERVVPYSATSGELLRDYLRHRRSVGGDGTELFLSESPRNYAAPISMWTWSKVVRSIAIRAGVPAFSTHTLRHLCLTDLARAGWQLHEIARFAGHQNLETTRQYVHLSGHDLADRFATTMRHVHAWRLEALGSVPVAERP